MSQIQSSAGEAQAYATSLSGAGQTLSGVATATQDSQTTVAGNANAHSAISLAQSTASSVAATLTSAIANVGSVAEAFRVVDQDTAASIDGGS